VRAELSGIRRAHTQRKPRAIDALDVKLSRLRNIGLALVQAAGALALLYIGGEALVRGASALAAHMGVSPLAIGLTVVAFGTSAPELAVSIDAALAGANDISVGNVVGSNIANVALILGLAALIRPMAVQAKVVFLDSPVMILVSLLLLAVLANGEASRLEGALIAASLVVYVVFTLWEARREPGLIREEFSSAVPPATLAVPWSLLLVVAGLALLTGGGHVLVTAAVSLAASAGVSQAAIGLTIDEFEETWRTSLLEKHADQTWLATAQDFNPNRAMETVNSLAGPDFAGRKAGSPGSDGAAVLSPGC